MIPLLAAGAFNGLPQELRWNIRGYIAKRKSFPWSRTTGRLPAYTIITPCPPRECVRGAALVSQDIRRGILSVVVCQITRAELCRQKQPSVRRKGHAILHGVSVKPAGPNPKVGVTFHACRDKDLSRWRYTKPRQRRATRLHR